MDDDNIYGGEYENNSLAEIGLTYAKFEFYIMGIILSIILLYAIIMYFWNRRSKILATINKVDNVLNVAYLNFTYKGGSVAKSIPIESLTAVLGTGKIDIGTTVYIYASKSSSGDIVVSLNNNLDNNAIIMGTVAVIGIFLVWANYKFAQKSKYWAEWDAISLFTNNLFGAGPRLL